MTQPQLDDAHIREAAYLMWLDEGQPEGRDQEHWLRAIDALKTSAPKTKKSAKPRAKAKAAAAPKTAKPKAAKAAAPRKRAIKTAKS